MFLLFKLNLHTNKHNTAWICWICPSGPPYSLKYVTKSTFSFIIKWLFIKLLQKPGGAPGFVHSSPCHPSTPIPHLSSSIPHPSLCLPLVAGLSSCVVPDLFFFVFLSVSPSCPELFSPSLLHFGFLWCDASERCDQTNWVRPDSAEDRGQRRDRLNVLWNIKYDWIHLPSISVDFLFRFDHFLHVFLILTLDFCSDSDSKSFPYMNRVVLHWARSDAIGDVLLVLTFSLLPSICSSSWPSTSLALNSGTYCSMLSPRSHWQTCWVVHEDAGQDGSSQGWGRGGGGEGRGRRGGREGGGVIWLNEAQ